MINKIVLILRELIKLIVNKIPGLRKKLIKNNSSLYQDIKGLIQKLIINIFLIQKKLFNQLLDNQSGNNLSLINM